MTHSKMKMALLCVAIGISMCGIMAGAPPQQQSTPGALREIQMTAKRFEFDPSVITVNKGDHVKLVITAMDRDHGIALPAFGIKQRLKKGVPTTIEFDADKAGTFPFHCSVFCGMGHRGMKGKLVVKAD